VPHCYHAAPAQPITTPTSPLEANTLKSQTQTQTQISDTTQISLRHRTSNLINQGFHLHRTPEMQSSPPGGPQRLPAYKVDPRVSICPRCCRADAREAVSGDHEVCCDKCGCVLASSFAHKYDDEQHTGRGEVAAAGFESLGGLDIKTGSCQGSTSKWTPYAYAGAKTSAADKRPAAVDAKRQQKVTKHIRNLATMLDLHAGLERAAIKLSVPGKGGLAGVGTMMPKPREIAAAAVVLASEKTKAPKSAEKVADFAECTTKQLNRARRALLISRSPAKVAKARQEAAATALQGSKPSGFAAKPVWHPLVGGGCGGDSCGGGGGGGGGGDSEAPSAASTPTPPPPPPPPVVVKSETSVVLNKCLLAIVQGSQRLGVSFAVITAAKDVATEMWKRGLLEGSRPASIAAGAFKFAATQNHVKVTMKDMVAAFKVTQGTIQKHFKVIQKACKPEPMPTEVKVESVAAAVAAAAAAAVAEMPTAVKSEHGVQVKTEPIGFQHAVGAATAATLPPLPPQPTAAPTASLVQQQEQQEQLQAPHQPWTLRSTTILRAAADLGVAVDLDLVSSLHTGIGNTERKHGAHAVGFRPFPRAAGGSTGCYVEVRSSGKISCMGASSVDEARQALGECARRIRQLTRGGPYEPYLYDAAAVGGFQVQAFCLNVDFGARIPLGALAARVGPLCGGYDPDTFPAVTYYSPVRPPMNLRIFASGKVRVNGAKSVAEAEAALAELHHRMREGALI